MRHVLPILLLLAGCSKPTADNAVLNRVEAEQRRAQEEDGQIACAKPGADELRPSCIVERSDSTAGLILTIRHPDGAFRRLLVTRDGRGVIAADGAEPAAVRVLAPDRIEVAVAGERYELPATVKGGAAKP